MKKTLILDTNVILHDSDSIFQFEENDIVIPITVIEELDAFKKGQNQVNYHARQFIRYLDTLPGEGLVNGGVKMGDNKGLIRILTHYTDQNGLSKIFHEYKPDHRILSAALHLQKALPHRAVVLVSKDVNLRLKAKSLGLMAQDYYSDKIKDIKNLYRGIRLVEDYDPQIIDRMYTEHSAPLRECAIDSVMPNEYFILRNGNKSALAYYNPRMDQIENVKKNTAYGIIPRNSEQTFSLHALMNPDLPLVTLSGKAGTGKTLLALAGALERRKLYKQIFLARPIVALSNRDIGFLPGDVQSKIDPYMQPLYDNLGVIRGQYKESENGYQLIGDLLENNKLLISPLAYIRGRSLNNIYFIVDEAQNLTPHEVKTIITRAGEGTKVVFTGDPHQIDTPYLDSRSTGLSYVIERMKDQPLHAHVTLEKGERSELAELASNLL